MGVCDWIRDNILLFIILFLAALVGIGGLIIIGYGIYVVASFSDYVGGFEDGGIQFYVYGITLIGIGSFAVVAACIGFYAVYTTVACVFIVFIAALWIVVLLEMMVAIFAFNWVHKKNNEELQGAGRSACDGHILECLAYQIDRAFINEYDRPEMKLSLNGTAAGPTSLFFDAMHRNLHCCGSNGPQDFAILKIPIPRSCDTNPEFDSDADDTQVAQKKGCKPLLVDWLKKTIHMVGLIAAIFAILTAFVALFACIAALVYLIRKRNCVC